MNKRFDDSSQKWKNKSLKLFVLMMCDYFILYDFYNHIASNAYRRWKLFDEIISFSRKLYDIL